MAHYFGQPKQEVVPWLKTVFAPLAELEDSYIKGKLCSSEHFRHFETEHSEARLLRDEKGSGGFQLFIDLIPILQWFRQKAKEFLERLGIEIKDREQGPGMRIR